MAKGRSRGGGSGFSKTRIVTIGIAAVAGVALFAKLLKAARDGKKDPKQQGWTYKAADTLGVTDIA